MDENGVVHVKQLDKTVIQLEDFGKEEEPDKPGKPHKKKTLVIVGVVLGISLLILGAGVGCYLYYQPYDRVVLEVGDRMIEPDALLKHGQKGSSFVEPVSVDMGHIGSYPVKIKNGLFTYKTVVEVVDTVAPEVTAKESYEFYQDTEVSPEEFLQEIRDLTKTTASFAETVDFSRWGWQDVDIVVTDEGNNETRVSVRAHILDRNVITYLERERNQPVAPENLFVDGTAPGEYTLEPTLDTIDFGEFGHHNIQMHIHEDIYTIDIYVCDRVAPVGTVPESYDWWTGTPLEAARLVSNIQDDSEVTVFFKEELDYSKAGTVPVTVVLRDAFDNQTEYTSTLVLAEDTQAPAITVSGDLHISIGENANYYSGVSAVDNKDGEVKPQVDKSQVNEGVEGSYTVTYTARDSSGNTATQTRTVVVSKERTVEDKLNEQVQAILGKIITPGMSQREKARAIYDWTHNNIGFVNHTEERDWRKNALDGIKQRQGDCFTYFAVSKALLTAVGIDNLDITRSKNSTRTSPHYWNLVNLGDGWYHFDACRVRANPPLQGFMFTDTYAEQFSANQVSGYFTYDKEKYPDIVD